MLKEAFLRNSRERFFCGLFLCAAGGISAKHQASSIKRKPEWDCVSTHGQACVPDVPAARWNTDAESVSQGLLFFSEMPLDNICGGVK